MGRLITLISVLSVVRLAPFWCRQGMFFDGLDYASISRNLAIGRGTFWHTSYSRTLYPVFYEHPPLLFWLQSLLFRVSESVFVEKLFSAVVFFITLILLLRLVSLLLPKRHGGTALVTACSVVPWVLYSTTAFAHTNNLLEAPMGMFALAATLALIAAAQSQQRLRRALWMVTGSGLVVAAVLTKGIPGVFPVMVPLAYRLTTTPRKITRGCVESALVLALVVGSLAILFGTHAEARDFLQHYWTQQVMASVSGVRTPDQLPHPLLTILGYLVDIALPSLLLLGAVLIGRRRSNGVVWREYLPSALFLGLMALSASLPLAASQRVSRYYLAPSMLFYAPALGFAAAALWPSNPAAVTISRRWWQRIRVSMATALALVVVWVAVTWGTPRRDEACFELVGLLRDEAVWDTTVEVSPTLDWDWSLRAYLQRYLRVSVQSSQRPTQAVYVVPVEGPLDLPAGYVPVKVSPISKYQLLRRAPLHGPPSTPSPRQRLPL